MSSSKKYKCYLCGKATSSRKPEAEKRCQGCSRRKPWVAKSCMGCSALFEAKPSQHIRGLAKYCSNACRYRNAKPGPKSKARETLHCDYCSNQFERKASASKYQRTFCSRSCYEGSLAAKRAEKTCKRCGVGFSIPLSDHLLGRGLYCSKDCVKSPRSKVVCLGCGTETLKQQKHIDRAKNGNFCTQECWTSWNTRDRVYNWTGGDPQKRDHRDKGPWRKSVLERDGWTCQLCPAAKGLEVHHILPYATHPEVRWETTNGVVLCQRCHRGIRGREVEESRRLQEIVKKNEDAWNTGS